MEAIRDGPLLGTGYGTFADAFRAYNHPGTGTYFLDKAHNTYLQIAMELGWPAAAALYSGLAWLVLGCLRGQERGVAGVPRVLLGAGRRAPLVDFSLEMPAMPPSRPAPRDRLRAVGPRPARLAMEVDNKFSPCLFMG